MSNIHLKQYVVILSILALLVACSLAFDRLVPKNSSGRKQNQLIVKADKTEGSILKSQAKQNKQQVRLEGQNNKPEKSFKDLQSNKNQKTTIKNSKLAHDSSANADSKLSTQERTERAKNIALTRYVGPGSRADDGYRTKHSSKSKDGCWPLPKKLCQELSHVDLRYYESIQQPHDNTCGSRSLANALAIRDSLELKSVDPKSIKKQAARYNWLHTTDNLTNVAIVKQARQQKLDNVYVLDYLTSDLNRKNCKKANPFTIISSTDHNEMVHGGNDARITKEVIEKIRSRGDIAAHFICFLEPTTQDNIAHAVDVSVIKQKDKKPTMIYMDSCNTPLAQEWQAQAYMSYIYQTCLAA